MEEFTIPAGTVVHVHGFPVALASDTKVETFSENVKYITRIFTEQADDAQRLGGGAVAGA